MQNTIKENLSYLTPYCPKVKRLGDKEYIQLKEEGYTIKGVQKLLKEKDASVLLRSDASGLDSVIASDEEHAGPDPKTKMALQNIRETLEKAKLLLKTDETQAK